MAIKTLHLTNAYHPTSGGVRTFYRAMLDRANAERRRMRLIVPGEHDDVEDVGGFGRIYFVRSDPAPAFDRRYRMIRPPPYLRQTGRLRDILRCEQPDLIEICDKYSLCHLAALLRRRFVHGVRRPVLVGLSCERMDDNVAAYLAAGAAGRAFARRYIRHIYGPPFDAHIANSEYTADELRRCLWDRDPGFITVAPMGVEVQSFGPVHRDRQYRRQLLSDCGGTPESTLLLYAGRLSPEKNVGLLIDMMASLSRISARYPDRDYRLVIAGDGPLARMALLDAGNWHACTRAPTSSCIRIRASRLALPRSRPWRRVCQWWCPMPAACSRTPRRPMRGWRHLTARPSPRLSGAPPARRIPRAWRRPPKPRARSIGRS